MFNLRRCIASGSLHHVWKREMRIVVAPFSSSSSADRQIITSSCSAENAKSCIFGKLQFLFTETLDYITREEEKKGVTKDDIVELAKQLNKDGKSEYALEIFEWMDKKKMEFSPSELAFFVDLIAKTKSLAAAKEYFNQVEPDFDRTNTRAKNWPAFASIMLMED
ncbi:pentatricopeptide repeat-containing protein At1g02370, mitochondrial-like [Raphanus sativus]|uniref:Pentatricopeptide repeat-containing protein At1g02370, mitochondrial-like n=1 Tax=Raphanus sativus TaxID=3726 RepID=A0A6J0NZC2_RAPSA|nr:pentatricopeptide repeat-containing protein At1g02370, mitochondrial-like [Raphanus sativus]